MKICTKCLQKLPAEKFAKKNNKQFHAHCKTCQKEVNQKHYIKHTNKIKQKANQSYIERRDFINSLKTNRACVDCGIVYKPWQMDFDHLDSQNKIAGLAQMRSSRYSKEAILEEISKCELVCANCHRDRTYKRNLDGSLTTATSGPV